MYFGPRIGRRVAGRWQSLLNRRNSVFIWRSCMGSRCGVLCGKGGECYFEHYAFVHITQDLKIRNFCGGRSRGAKERGLSRPLGGRHLWFGSEDESASMASDAVASDFRRQQRERPCGLERPRSFHDALLKVGVAALLLTSPPPTTPRASGSRGGLRRWG